MSIQAPYYPIVYVRGFAATMSEIEETVADPYMGFNLGSTKVRQDYHNEVVKFIFESPLIRLRKEEEYVDAYKNGDYVREDQPVSSRSVWVYRYYEPDSETFGDGEKDTMESYAKGLGAFIERIRDQVCRGDAEQEAKFKVYLVAHSMGGLICRCYLQNVKQGREHHVDKVFTYATPHNGIDMFGLNAPDIGALDKLHVSNFNRDRIAEYLKLQPQDGKVNSLGGAFPPERFFCFIGTNYRDYDAFYTLSRRATGPSGDGLVMMRNAYVHDAPRAFAHRSHSGHYGIVNSEEGYQNLRRFLFGQVAIEVKLIVDEMTLPHELAKRKAEGEDLEIRARYNIDVAAKVRGAGCYLTERRVTHRSAVRKSYDRLLDPNAPVYLFSGYLTEGARANDRDTALAFAIELSIEVPVFEVDRRFWFDEHFEGETLVDDTVTLHLRRPQGESSVKYGLKSELGVGRATRPVELSQPDAEGRVHFEIPIGFKEGLRNPPKPGLRGRLLFSARPWNPPEEGAKG